MTMRTFANGSEAAVAELIERLGRCAYGYAFAAGFNHAQWTALRYFARANRFSRTVTAFAKYHSTTLGTASQTVKVLVDKGYLKRTKINEDRRSHRLEITPKTKRLLARQPNRDLALAVRTVALATRSTMIKGMQTILAELLEHDGRPVFGTCTSCEHLRSAECCQYSDTGYECAFVDVPLLESELTQLCVAWQRPAGSP